VWEHEAKRLAAVVADEAPFSIEIVQPKAPLVRNGSMQLKVVATRKEGFTAPISVRMLYNPPGISASASIKIDEGKTEAEIPLTANNGAQLNTWKIAVLGVANGGNGNVEVSTQLADLEVAESFFNLAFQKAAAEQGQETQMVVTVEQKTPFEGSGTAQLVGLPNGATTEPLEFTKETETLNFKIMLAADARVGRHQTILCQAVVTQAGEPVSHTLGTGEIRIDVPIPPKNPTPAPAAVAAAPAEQPKPEVKEAPAKPLSRLEQLRLQKKQEEEAAQK
jgi:hypothetical protein